MNLVISHFSDERLQGEDKQDELEIEENESSDPIFRRIIGRVGRRVIRRFRRRRRRVC